MITVEPVFFEKMPEELNEEWNRLLQSAEPPNFQYDFVYMSAWTEFLRENWHPFLLLVKEGEAILDIFPLMYLDEKRRGILPYRRVRFLASSRTAFPLYWLTLLTRLGDRDCVCMAVCRQVALGNLIPG